MKSFTNLSYLALATLLTLGFKILVDGALDTTFDTDGKVLTDVISNCGVNSVAIQSDGKIVAAGWVGGAGFNQGFGLTRYNSSDGSLDNSFDTDGKVLTQFQANTYAEATAVAIQSDGKIVAAGFGSIGGVFSFLVARYNTNGSLDTGFDSDGKAVTQIGISDDRAYAIALQADGKIVVAGYSTNGSDWDLAVVRYNTNGSLDNTFDGDGIMTATVGSEAVAQSVAIQSDGKIVIGGTGRLIAGTEDFMVARFNTNGTPDTGFDTDGFVTTPIGSAEDHGSGVGVQADGKIVLAGYTYTGTKYNFALARYSSTGALDASFDTDGKVTTSISSDSDFVYAMALQLDGKIVVAGLTENGWNTGTVVVARYTTSGALDAGFDSDGKQTTSFGGLRDVARSVAIQSDGKIVVAGEYYNVGYSFILGRYTGSSGPLPVELSSFTGHANGMNAELQWATTTEMNNRGFEIERRSVNNDQSTMNSWAGVGFVSGAGASNAPREYGFTDRNLSPGKYSYRLKQIDRDGNFRLSSAVELTITVPRELALAQNYPNPFNPSTTIEFTLPMDGKVSLKIFDAVGREVSTLVNGQLKAGELHRVVFDASGLSSGIYFSRLQYNDKKLMKKLLLVK